MMSTAVVAVAVLLAAVLTPCQSQVVFQQVQRLRNLYQPYLEQTQMLRQHYATFSLPLSIDNQALLAEELEQQQAMPALQLQTGSTGQPDAVHAAGISASGHFVFGKHFSVDLTLSHGTWLNLPDGGRVWRLALHSRAALSLNVLFEEFELPQGSEFYVRTVPSPFAPASDESSTELLGPFTHWNNKDHGKFATQPLPGNTLLLEYFAPASVQQELSLRVNGIVHGYKPTLIADPQLGTFGSNSGSCNINVNCELGEGWQNQIRSVVLLLSRSGTGYCSGSMLNNVRKDGRQLFLTAFHCAGTGDHSYDMVMFNYQRKSCDNRSPLQYQRQTAQGLKRLAALYSSDFALFEVEEKIPKQYDVYLAGWSADPKAVPVTPVGIHHPSVDVKKISFSFLNCSETCWAGTCSVFGKADHWQVPRWSKGTTEPGSSGSPLFDGLTHRVVGQLHGGSASCYNMDGYDVYGKISHSFTEGGIGNAMKTHLDPENSGALFMDGDDLKALQML